MVMPSTELLVCRSRSNDNWDPHRCGCPRNPESGISPITSRNVVFPGVSRSSILRITLVITFSTPRRTRSQETEMGRRAPARRRRRGARTPALVPLPKKKSPHSSSRAPRDAPDRGRACACLRRPPTLLSLFHTLPLRASPPSARGRRDSAAAAAATRERWECACAQRYLGGAAN